MLLPIPIIIISTIDNDNNINHTIMICFRIGPRCNTCQEMEDNQKFFDLFAGNEKFLAFITDGIAKERQTVRTNF
jgi:hypothetical protein